MNTSLTSTAPNDLAKSYLEQAKEELSKIVHIENGMLRDRNELLERAWNVGRLLIAMKDNVKSGNWLLWLEFNWPELTIRNSQRCIVLFRENSNAIKSTHTMVDFKALTPDSVRKFMFGYVPVKERKALAGNQFIAPHAHPLTFANNFLKWDRQAELGLIKRPPIDVFRRDMEPIIKRMAELAGKEWVQGVLA